MIKACLFSLDGVIVDTARCRFLAWKRLAAELGFEFTELQNESLRGVSRFEALGILLRAGGLTGRFDVGQKVRMASCQAGWYREYVGRMTEAEAVAEVKLRSRQYAKRQLTWLRRNEAIHWILWDKVPDFPSGLQNATKFLTSSGVC